MYSRKHRSGQVGYIVRIGLINDKRERHSFKTKDEANIFAELKRAERQNHSCVATRRGGCAAVKPWVETHGYLHSVATRLKWAHTSCCVEISHPHCARPGKESDPAPEPVLHASRRSDSSFNTP